MMHKNIQNALRAAVSEFVFNPDLWNISVCGIGAVYQLEKKFSRLVGHPYALSVSNATLGLWAVFRALKIHNADVVTTPYTWGGTLASLVLSGNRPVFADIDKNSLTLDPDQVVKRITPRTKAILAVDIYGYPCNGAALRKVADEHGLVLIQDCAQSFGAYMGKHHTGWWADASVFSLGFGKALFAGEGGMIVTGDNALFNKLVWQTQHPYRQLRDIPQFPLNEMAANLRIHPFSATWADRLFDKVLCNIRTYHHNCIEILKLLKRKHITNSKVPDIRKVRPSFHVLTFEPSCDILRIEEFLRGKGLFYQVTLPPIIHTVYTHTAYRKLFLSNKAIESHHCPIAEKQIKLRLRLVKKEKSKEQSFAQDRHYRPSEPASNSTRVSLDSVLKELRKLKM
jgi:perosamine synthetase